MNQAESWYAQRAGRCHDCQRPTFFTLCEVCRCRNEDDRITPGWFSDSNRAMCALLHGRT